MNRIATKMSTTVDYEQDGKQTGFIRLPHSVHRSAYGWLPIPVACVKHGQGPTVLLMAGTHGDEYEGQVALSKLICNLEVDQIQGRIIVLPMVNFPAAKAGLRTSPIDELNLNRVYPGDPEGPPTMMIAHYVESVLMKMADYALDLHSGGSSLHYLPCTIATKATDAGRRDQVKELMQSFGAPHAFFFPSGHAGGTTNHAAERQGVLMVGTEMGGSGTVSADCLAICERNVQRFLAKVGVLKNASAAVAPASTRMLHAPNFRYFCYASGEGLFEPVAALGDEVQEGDLAGYVHTPEDPGCEPTEARFEASGLVVCRRTPGRVIRGDCLYHLGCDL